MQGRIIKGIAGFYYVYASDGEVYECKARGIFRKDRSKPMVGDKVMIDIIDAGNRLGNISELLPRDNELIRPAVANVDQALIVFALTHPVPNFLLLDKILLQFRRQGLPVILCFNKEDLVKDEETVRVREIYRNSGTKIFFTCATGNQGIRELKAELAGRLSFVAGPSGVGKSSIINCLQDDICVETQEISRKAERGRHTTRHSEIIPVNGDTFIMDTPGFSSFDISCPDCEELRDYYNEFIPYNGCRFSPCSHTHEPDCSVKEAVKASLISAERYNNYVAIYTEIKNLRRY